MLLFWSPWFKYRFIKIDLVTEGIFCFNYRRMLGGVGDCVNREFKITTTETATRTSLNKRFNEQNNGSARAL